MIDIPTAVIIAGAAFAAGYALACCMAASGRADERAERVEQLCALRLTLDPWVQYIRAALAFYDNCGDDHIVASLDVTACQGRAFLGAFGLGVT